MGLRCLLGHEYANREVEREREERGNEVVVTYRTVETCDRCGERRIVSENKEVRPVRNPRDDEVTTGLGGGGVTPDVGESADEADSSVGTEPEPQPETPGDEPTPAATEPTDVPDAEGAASADGTEPTATDASTDETDDVDDAIILDDDGADEDGTDRGHGEWPETAEIEAESEPEPEPDTVVDDGATVVSGDEGWPDTEGEDEGFDAEPSDGTPTEVSFGGGLAPERADETVNGETGAEAAAASNGTTGGSVAGKQFVAAEGVERVGEESDGETEFFCPNCGYARVAGGSSMRAGDICPECHKGYIAERERP